jgi:hypothetical protein
VKDNLVLIISGASLIYLVTACGPNPVLENSNNRQTQQAQETAQVQTAVFVGTQVGTLVALQATADTSGILATQMAQMQQEGRYLQATIDAVTTLGVPLIPRYTPTFSSPNPSSLGSGPVALITPSPSVLNRAYQDIRTATDVDSNGCPVDKRGRFSENIDRVYFTALGAEVAAGTRHQVRWLFEGQVRVESPEWVSDGDYSNICIYFWLSTADTNFEAGLWRADFLINGELYVEVPFELCEAGELC